METTTKKVTPEDLKKLKDLEETYQRLTIEFGQNYVEKMLTEQHLNDILNTEEQLRNKYQETEKTQDELHTYFTKTYGEGQINIETEEWTPKK
jgi:uncharacterized protein (DUF342 family)